MKQSVFILLFMSIFGFFGIADAQLSVSPQAIINIEMTPENPKPNEIVHVSLTSYSTNINTAKITWTINGKVQKFGIGEKSFDFSAGNINTTTTLEILIETQEGESVEKTLVIKPVTVDLIWESEGFVPPFYKGKSLFTHQNKITLIAIPHITSANGTEIGAKNLIYTWKKNGTIIDSSSGFGKNTYSFVSSLISRPINIEVNVTTVDSSGAGYNSITLTPTDPLIFFYRKDPILGIEFQKALFGSTELKNSKEIVVVGMPFFFGTTNQNSLDLSYKWFINGSRINIDQSQSTQVFRQQDGTSGISKIGLSVENTNKILQYTSSNFNLVFGNNNQQND